MDPDVLRLSSSFVFSLGCKKKEKKKQFIYIYLFCFRKSLLQLRWVHRELLQFGKWKWMFCFYANAKKRHCVWMCMFGSNSGLIYHFVQKWSIYCLFQVVNWNSPGAYSKEWLRSLDLGRCRFRYHTATYWLTLSQRHSLGKSAL